MVKKVGLFLVIYGKTKPLSKRKKAGNFVRSFPIFLSSKSHVKGTADFPGWWCGGVRQKFIDTSKLKFISLHYVTASRRMPRGRELRSRR